MDRSGSVLGAFWVRLRVSWEPPWPVLWASCERLGASWKHIVLDVHAKRSLNLGMPSQMPFLIDLFPILPQEIDP